MENGNRTSQVQRRNIPPIRAGAAFTMLELMTVMAIIIILVSIIMPTVGVFLDTSRLSKSRARVNGLDAAIRQYQRELQNDWPGQRCLTDTGFPTNGLYTDCDQGSQWLTMAIFPQKDSTRRHSHVGTYMTFTPDMVDCAGTYSMRSPGGTVRIDTVLDAFAKPMPVLYYVSRPRVSGWKQYTPSTSGNNLVDVQNSVLTNNFKDPNGRGLFNDPNIVIDKRYWTTGTLDDSLTPVRDKEFLLFGAGRDRGYFAGNSDDDVKNFSQ